MFSVLKKFVLKISWAPRFGSRIFWRSNPGSPPGIRWRCCALAKKNRDGSKLPKFHGWQMNLKFAHIYYIILYAFLHDLLICIYFGCHFLLLRYFFQFYRCVYCCDPGCCLTICRSSLFGWCSGVKHGKLENPPFLEDFPMIFPWFPMKTFLYCWDFPFRLPEAICYATQKRAMRVTTSWVAPLSHRFAGWHTGSSG